MFYLRICALLVVLPFLAQSQEASQKLAGHAGTTRIAVDISVKTWLDNYLKWAAPKMKKDVATDEPPPPVMLKMPYLELFSPDGQSLYRGTNAAENATFLQGLPESIPSSPMLPDAEWHPSLREYFKIVTPLQPYESQVAASRRFTVLAVTFPDKPFCKAENDALIQFGHRANIRLIEVRLHS